MKLITWLFRPFIRPIESSEKSLYEKLVEYEIQEKKEWLQAIRTSKQEFYWLRRKKAGRIPNLEGAILRGIQIPKINLRKVNLRQANLSWANLQGADLEGADLEGADLRYSNLINTNLQKANLSKSNLFGTNLVGANTWKTNFTKANICDARLKDKGMPVPLETVVVPVLKIRGPERRIFKKDRRIATKKTKTPKKHHSLKGKVERKTVKNKFKKIKTQLSPREDKELKHLSKKKVKKINVYV